MCVRKDLLKKTGEKLQVLIHFDGIKKNADDVTVNYCY